VVPRVGQLEQLPLARVDPFLDDAPVLLEQPVVGRSEDLSQNVAQDFDNAFHGGFIIDAADAAPKGIIFAR
jgi:hypothetical protein